MTNNFKINSCLLITLVHKSILFSVEVLRFLEERKAADAKRSFLKPQSLLCGEGRAKSFSSRTQDILWIRQETSADALLRNGAQESCSFGVRERALLFTLRTTEQFAFGLKYLLM
ncbi:hypothetical protein CDAR_529331 [Caerostris darwini]|uniref:Uncharacterized protein n=1 Tax=Caerostris darwini TaxID=1538125 RepID=A0AAV4TY49_9ARAC|nr:hypothetical protein CDAR_529331 [Caerostris darwini]